MTGQIHIHVAVNSTDSRIARQAESFRCFRYLLFYIGMSISRIVFLLVPEFVINMKAYIFVYLNLGQEKVRYKVIGVEMKGV